MDKNVVGKKIFAGHAGPMLSRCFPRCVVGRMLIRFLKNSVSVKDKKRLALILLFEDPKGV